MSDLPPVPEKKSDLPIRALVGLALIAIAAVALILGGVFFWLLAVAGALVMIGEWADLNGASQFRRLSQYALTVPLAIMAPVAAGPRFLALGMLAGAAFFMVIVTRRRELAIGILYCGLPVLALLLIRKQPDIGLLFAFCTLSLVWATDIGAYFAGRTIGGPKLAPTMSPNKTWAGLGGGVLAAAALGLVLHAWYGLPLRLTLASPFLAVLAQGGDLFESMLKRRAGVKDSGNILPGHGGVMDRLDGLVPVAPVAAFLVILPDFYGYIGW